jgi:hypothetical protein
MVRPFASLNVFARSFARSFAILALICLAATPAAVAQQTFQLGTERTHVIPDNLQAGATFDEANLPVQKIVEWYRIPKWFAGTTIRTRVASVLGFSIKDVRQRERGRQFDARGNVWEARREPIRYDITQKAVVVHTVLIEEKPLKVARDLVAMRYHAMMILESIKKHKIVKSFQTVQVHVFTPNADGSINATIDNAAYFGPDGAFQGTSPVRASYVERKIAEFAPTDRDEKFDYKSSFISFLQATGRSDLIPGAGDGGALENPGAPEARVD